nr:MAG TPA: hypothetical protein [Caudoviricetes sp.]
MSFNKLEISPILLYFLKRFVYYVIESRILKTKIKKASRYGIFSWFSGFLLVVCCGCLVVF